MADSVEDQGWSWPQARALSPEAPRWLPLAWVVSVVVPGLLATFIYLGTVWLTLAGVVIAAALILWLRTTYRRPANPGILPWYLTAIVVHLGHVAERWAGGYAEQLTRLLPTAFEPPVAFDEARLVLVIAIGATTVFLVAGVSLLRGGHVANFVAWTLAAWLITSGGSDPLLIAIAGEFRYLPGMGTGPIAVATGIGLARALWHCAARQERS